MKHREIYTLKGCDPEELAHSISTFSRPDKSIKDIKVENSHEFIKKWYVNNGHKSIGDIVHIPMILENVSLLAELEIVDEPLWDGMCRSTRYQDFNVEDGFYMPDFWEYKDTEHTKLAEYKNLLDEAMKLYDKWYKRAEEKIREYNKDHIEEISEYKIKSRAFDIARYFLPLAAKTSIGQVTSLRTLEKQIGRLIKTDYEELLDITDDMKRSLNQPYSPNLDFDSEIKDSKVYMSDLLDVSYAFNDSDRDALRKLQFKELMDVKIDRKRDWPGCPVRNRVDYYITKSDQSIDIIAKYIYLTENLPYERCLNVAESFNPRERQRIITKYFPRARHSHIHPIFKSRPLIFDVTMDIGSYRDLNRHRNLIKFRKPLDSNEAQMIYFQYGCDFDFGLKIHEDGLRYLEMVKKSNLPEFVKHYLLPLGSSVKALFCMDVDELVYLSELRTQKAGHFSYRDIAYQMYKQGSFYSPFMEEVADVEGLGFEDVWLL